MNLFLQPPLSASGPGATPVTLLAASPGLLWWMLLGVSVCAFSVVVWAVVSELKHRRQTGYNDASDATDDLFARFFRPIRVADLTATDLGIDRFFSYYHSRPESDSRLQTLLREKKNVLISGCSGIGKRRSLLEALLLDPELADFTLLRPLGTLYPPLVSTLGVPQGNFLILLRDIDRFCDAQGTVQAMITRIQETGKDILLIGTVCDGKARRRFDSGRDLFDQFEEVRLEELTRVEMVAIAEQTSCQDILQEATHSTPLDTLVPLQRLASRMDNLSRDETDLLTCLKTLRYLNQDFESDHLKSLFVSACPDRDFPRAVAGIRSNGFVGFDGAKRFIISDRVLELVGEPDAPMVQSVIEELLSRQAHEAIWIAALQLFEQGDLERSQSCFSVLAAKGERDPCLIAYCDNLSEEPEAASPASKPVNEAYAEPKREALELAVLGETDEAIRKLRDLIALDANDADCHFWLAEMHQRIGELEAAERHFKQGLRADAMDARAHLEYGKFLERREQHRPAMSEYLTAGLLKILNDTPDLDSLVQCDRMAKAIEDDYTAFLVAGLYAGSLFVSGEPEQARRYARDLAGDRGKVPLVDSILKTVLGEAPGDLVSGDDLEARAARALIEKIQTAASSTSV